MSIILKKMGKPKKTTFSYIVGIDEAGRGPLAGPVAVGLVCIPHDFDRKLFKKAKDSKMLSERVREEIFVETKDLHKKGLLTYAVSMVHAEMIDQKGITHAIRLSIKRCLKKCNVDPHETLVLLDGSLKAPKEFVHQKTIIKGDQKEKVIGLASIMAKVTRDRWMKKAAREYPEYGFEIHKGYGTKKHREYIHTYGPSSIHRMSYLSRMGKGL